MQHFNRFEHQKILDIKESNPTLALKMYEEYIKKYPYDYSAYTFYIDQLLALKQIDRAERELETLENMVENDRYYVNMHANKLEILMSSIHYLTVRLYFSQERYIELIDYMRKHSRELINHDINLVKLYALKRLGKLRAQKTEKLSYAFRQLIEYDEQEFLDHIKCHFFENEEVENAAGNFYSDFPLDTVLKEIRKIIPSDKHITTGILEDSYYFKYDHCGRHDRKVEDYFKVVCFHDTSDIITMYPIDFGENTNYTDLNYLKPKEEYKDDRPNNDRISKFYRRYGKE